MESVSFEKLKCWQESRKLVNDIYDATEQLHFSKDYSLKDQIKRAAISVMSNIAEGYGRNGNKEFIQFLSIARGSVFEVQSQLYIALDRKYINQESFNLIKAQADKTSNLINGFIKYLKSDGNPGYKVAESSEGYLNKD